MASGGAGRIAVAGSAHAGTEDGHDGGKTRREHGRTSKVHGRMGKATGRTAGEGDGCLG
ncbi:hypothetical protein ABTW76_29465 [Paenibacillus dendritiformis]